MFRPLSEQEPGGNEADVALRQGLHELPVPEVASDFDARVHAALRRPTPWWRLLWVQARPILSTAACSLVVTLVLLKTDTTPPGRLQPAASGTLIADSVWEHIEALDRSDLSVTPLSGFATLPRPPAPEARPPKKTRRPATSQTHS